MVDARMRAADADRERVVSFLQTQVGTGRLDLDEFSERSAAAYRARTLGDLDVLTQDLPAPPDLTTGLGPLPGLHPTLVPTVIATLTMIVLLGAALMMLAGMRDAGPMGQMMTHTGP